MKVAAHTGTGYNKEGLVGSGIEPDDQRDRVLPRWRGSEDRRPLVA